MSKPVGKFFSHVGHGMGHINIYVGGLCLFPEEMVFMMESNNLEATADGGLPLSMAKERVFSFGHHIQSASSSSLEMKIPTLEEVFFCIYKAISLFLGT